MHKSNPNNSNDRRIGLNIQYLATHVKQLKHNKDSAICVRGVDKFKNFLVDKPAIKDLSSNAVKKFYNMDAIYKKTQQMN